MNQKRRPVLMACRNPLGSREFRSWFEPIPNAAKGDQRSVFVPQRRADLWISSSTPCAHHTLMLANETRYSRFDGIVEMEKGTARQGQNAARFQALALKGGLFTTIYSVKGQQCVADLDSLRNAKQ